MESFCEITPRVIPVFTKFFPLSSFFPRRLRTLKKKHEDKELTRQTLA